MSMLQPSAIKGLERCSMHTITTKPWSLRECIANFTAAGIPGITVWRQTLDRDGLKESAKQLKESGLTVTALCRGGFFPALDAAKRVAAIDDNRLAIDQAAAIGAPMVVLVCGAVPGLPLTESRKHISDGIAACVGHAKSLGVKLAIEPLHPMYAADRSAINTMRQAREVCDAVGSDHVGIAMDVYHTWWDPELEAEIKLSGAAKRLFAFHLCDWRVDTRDLLNDRGLMGEGCIDLRGIRAWMETAGFDGWHEIEIFSTERWAGDQKVWLGEVTKAYLKNC